MREILTEAQVKAILKSLDDAIDEGPWEESNFLRAIGRNLKEIRETLAEEIKKNYSISQDSLKQERSLSLKSHQREVFIALYSSEGTQLHSWERIIANLPAQTISRPIYTEEEHVRFLIKSKANKFNEAYVAIFIDEANILKLAADKMPFDKFGKPLIMLKDRAVDLENLTRFVHGANTYQYVKGHLQKVSEAE